METLQNIMLKDHARINNLLSELEQNFKREVTDFKESSKLFNKFKWSLEKHFFVEEKVISSIYNSCIDECQEMYDLLKEHKERLFLIGEVEDSIENKSVPDLQSLKRNLLAHKEFEDKIFYPKLEEELKEEDKKLILDRCEEVIR